MTNSTESCLPFSAFSLLKLARGQPYTRDFRRSNDLRNLGLCDYFKSMMFSPLTKHSLSAVTALILLVVSIASITSIWQQTHANTLWRIVNGSCVPNMEQNHNPSPCIDVDFKQGEGSGVAVLKDIKGKSQYLIMPTRKITGIESEEVWEPNAVNYFSHAWNDTYLVNQRLSHNLTRTDFAVAVNSISGRSQNQLHLHIDCIQRSVKSIFQQRDLRHQIGWYDLPTRLMGHHYRAMWLPGSELGTRNPFQLLADSLPNPAREMAAHTLVLVGARYSGEDGFILLDGQAPAYAVALSPFLKLGFGSGEELEDHNCQIAKQS